MNIPSIHRVSLLLAVLLAPGCTAVDGGAVEIRWDIRNVKGERIGCQGDQEDKGAKERLKLDRLFFQLELIPSSDGEDPCLQGSDCRFECTTGRNEILPGTTPFTIPEGEYLMASHAVGYSAASPNGQQLTAAQGVVAPPPVLRLVSEGEITDLNVNLIIVQY